MHIAEIRIHASHVVSTVGQTMFGLDEQIKMCLAALYTGGHVLLEGNPGLGKTELVKALAATLGIRSGRIQFTPDLMPADITGTLMPSGKGVLEFREGPIFTSLLLADEINRATPKTQSAMLEAMAEKRVTVLGEVRTLPAPFVVLATQNPIDHEGTYNLPAAQSDRFMFKVRIPSPPASILERIVNKRAGSGAPGRESLFAVAPPPCEHLVLPTGDDAAQMVNRISAAIRNVVPTDLVQTHITNLYLALNNGFAQLSDTAGSEADLKAAARHFQYGISPRAAGDIMLAAKAWVCLTDSDFENVAPSHLKAVVLPALRHRLKPSLDQDFTVGSSSDYGEEQDAFDRAIERLVALAAPKNLRHWYGW